MNNSPQLQTLFPSFEPELINEMLEKGTIRSFMPGDLLMKTGQYIRSVLLIISGLVKIYREDEDGDEYFIYYLRPGQACALSMICATKADASQLKAVATTETEVITIPLEYMDKWVMKYKGWYHFVLESYRSRFEELLTTIDHIAFRNMDERLLFYLKRQQKILKTDTLTVNNTLIAQELNSSREVISRLLKKLSEKGIVRMLDGQRVQLLQLGAIVA